MTTTGRRKTTILNRRDTSSDWIALNPVLGDGEFGVERTAQTGVTRVKVGDGVSSWTQLSYAINNDANPVTQADIDSAVTLHALEPVPHVNATSGRDFVALFQNGLI